MASNQEDLNETVYSIELDSENDLEVQGHLETSEGDIDEEINDQENIRLPQESSSDISPDESDAHSLDIELDNNNIPQLPQLPQLDITNYEGDTELEEDYENGWEWILHSDKDNAFDLPFTGDGGYLNSQCDRSPESFFNLLFDHAMWETIADNTNSYAHKKRRNLGENALQQMENPNYRRRSRLNDWKDIESKELKVFVAHLLIMGIVKKPDIEKYWCQDHFTRTPFFGQYMARDKFCLLLWNLHIADDSNNPAFGQPRHDPLAKIRPFHDMCLRNFRHIYKPKTHLSLDEGCCPWKGRLRFRCYNPSKPAKFHIKLFQIAEAESGYVVAFDVYTGKNSCVQEGIALDANCNTTTKTVLTLAHNANVLDKGHKLFFDNYYTSPELLEELLYRNTVACGTVRANRKGLPKALGKAKLKSGESCFRRKNEMLALRWCDKRAVYMISTMHCAVEVHTGKREYRTGLPIYKPKVIVDYTNKMGGVDVSDQLMGYYNFLRKSIKWWRKLWVHVGDECLSPEQQIW